MPKTTVTLILICLLLCLCINNGLNSAEASVGEFDKVAVVSDVIDGDTFDLNTGERIRLADINAPENATVGYQEAKDYVIASVEGKTVYLDIDDVYGTDTDGNRLVAVVYFSYNSTHYQNLNKALLDNDYAVLWDHDNEFSPGDWTLFVSASAIPEFSSITVLLLILSVSFFVLLVKVKKNCRGKSCDTLNVS